MHTVTQTRTMAALLTACLLSAGCGGSKVLKEPVAFTPAGPLAVGTQPRLEARLEWVIVRDGPGTWAKNADWDEYLMSLHSRGDGVITITSARIVDSLGTEIPADDSRKRLVKASRETTKRYKSEGVKVKAGLSGITLVAAGTAATVTAVGAAPAVILASSSVAAGVAGALLVGPALAVGGVVKGVNNGKVAKQIEARHTDLPLEIGPGESRGLDLFFALAPSPRRIELTYTDADGEHVLVVDTQEALAGLHIGKQAEAAGAE